MANGKYNRSFHLPWSPGGTSDDKRMASVLALIGQEIVITEKMDGGNGCLTKGGVYARSHAGYANEPWWNYVKSVVWAKVRWDIEDDLQCFGENVYPIHSIVYDELPAAFLVFGARTISTLMWWSWDDVEMLAACLELPTAPVLFRGVVNSIEELEKLTNRLAAQPSAFGPTREGLVVRVAREFADDEFGTVLGKWVRADHVQSDEHWSKHWQPQACFQR